MYLLVFVHVGLLGVKSSFFSTFSRTHTHICTCMHMHTRMRGFSAFIAPFSYMTTTFAFYSAQGLGYSLTKRGPAFQILKICSTVVCKDLFPGYITYLTRA